jgi:hypothetical protein
MKAVSSAVDGYMDTQDVRKPRYLVSSRTAELLLKAEPGSLQAKRVCGEGPPFIKKGAVVCYEIAEIYRLLNARTAADPTAL